MTQEVYDKYYRPKSGEDEDRGAVESDSVSNLISFYTINH
jgi:hypothetical protein